MPRRPGEDRPAAEQRGLRLSKPVAMLDDPMAAYGLHPLVHYWLLRCHNPALFSGQSQGRSGLGIRSRLLDVAEQIARTSWNLRLE